MIVGKERESMYKSVREERERGITIRKSEEMAREKRKEKITFKLNKR